MTIFDVPASSPTGLQILWLILIAVLWVGYFFLEGFDYGVGMLVPFVGKNDQSRRLVINTVGPHWDGNEVWLLTAGGATFAAFPGWYATLFSGLYVPLFLVLLGLILRGVAFEYRSKRLTATWRTVWDWLLAIGSLLPPLVFGVGFANFFQGVPTTTATDSMGTSVTLVAGTVNAFWGTFIWLFNPFALIGGLLFVAICLAHGAHFIALKTKADIHDRAQDFASKLGLIAGVLLLVFVIWGNGRWALGTLPGHPSWLAVVGWITGILAIVLMAGAWFMNSKNRDGWAFIGSGLAIVLLVVTIFTSLYPGLGFNNSNTLSNPLDITTASSSPHTLTLMTIFACIMVPIVLLYTIFCYWVFRRRLSVTNIPALEVTTAA